VEIQKKLFEIHAAQCCLHPNKGGATNAGPHVVCFLKRRILQNGARAGIACKAFVHSRARNILGLNLVGFRGRCALEKICFTKRLFAGEGFSLIDPGNPSQCSVWVEQFCYPRAITERSMTNRRGVTNVQSAESRAKVGRKNGGPWLQGFSPVIPLDRQFAFARKLPHGVFGWVLQIQAEGRWGKLQMGMIIPVNQLSAYTSKTQNFCTPCHARNTLSATENGKGL